MQRRSRAAALLAAAGLVAGLAGPVRASAQEPPSFGTVPPDPAAAPAAGTRAAPTFTQDWTRDVVVGKTISQSSPVVVDNLGNPFVAVGDEGGNLRAFDLDSGSSLPGWSSINVVKPVRAPLSTDGKYVYVPVGQDGKDRYPQYRKYAASGALAFNSNTGTNLNLAGGFLLSGLSIARVDNLIRGFGGSSGHWVYGVDANNRGAQMWGFRNADSTMATPALADLYGAGRPAVITSNDTSAEFAGDRNGGILRILTDKGKQICTATQLVSGNTYASSGYNNSSPAVAEVGGQPLIVFGSTGPTQFGVGANQLVAYDSGCAFKWATGDLGGRALASPTFADVLGTGKPQLLMLIAVKNGTATYPRVFVIDPATGRSLANTGTALAPYGASIAYTQATSLVTADFDEDGAQDIVVPAKQGQFLVLDGTDRSVLATIPTNMVAQNTPVITEEGNGLRVTVAGYGVRSGKGTGIVSSYTTSTGDLGRIGWSKFGNGPGLTGLQGTLEGPYNQVIESQFLKAGGTVRSANGAYTGTMQQDGNFVIRSSTGSVRFQTRTSTPGSYVALRNDGNLQILGPDLSVKWQSGVTGVGFERMVLGGDGVLKVYTGTWSGTRRLNTTKSIWSSAGR